MKYYKAVIIINGNKKSFWAEGEACVDYEIGIKARAPEWLAKQGYHLLVFDSLDRTKGFATPMLNPHSWTTEIYECRCRGEIKNLPISGDIWVLRTGNFNAEKYIQLGNCKLWPIGIHMFKEVTLTKKVWPEEVSR